jgi:hypothetical protein
MVNGKWNCFASLRRDSKSFSSMKLFLAMLPLILVAVFVIVSILIPKEIEEIVDLKYEKVVEVVNSSHNDNFKNSSSTFTISCSGHTNTSTICKTYVSFF